MLAAQASERPARLTFADWLAEVLGNAEFAAILQKHLLKASYARGSYLCRHGDPTDDLYFLEHGRLSAIVERGVTAVLDVSPAALPTGELHVYQGGRVLFHMPVVPGTAAIVPRAPSVAIAHGYVTKRAATPIVRLVATFSG